MKEIQTTKGRKGYEHCGYRYGHIKDTINEFKCTKNDCGVRLYVYNENFKLSGEHKHRKNNTAKYECKEKIKTLTKTNLGAVTIVSEILKQFDVVERNSLQKKIFKRNY